MKPQLDWEDRLGDLQRATLLLKALHDVIDPRVIKASWYGQAITDLVEIVHAGAEAVARDFYHVMQLSDKVADVKGRAR